MESLRFVLDLDDRKLASVRVLSSTVMNPYYGANASPVQSNPGGGSGSSLSEGKGHGSSLRESRFESSRAEFESTTARERHRSRCPVRGKVQCTQEVASELPAGGELAEFIEYTEGDRVQGGQVTLDIVATHNVDNPQCKVTLSDLKPSNDPEHKCRGSLPLKNGLLTCGCFVRAKAPDPLSHREVAGFDSMSKEKLRQLIISQYAQSGFNNCRVQPLAMMNVDQPLRLFVDPAVKPVAINKAAIIPIHLKARVKADLDRDVRLGILEKVDINSPVKWLSRMLVTMKKDGSPRRIIDYKKIK